MPKLEEESQKGLELPKRLCLSLCYLHSREFIISIKHPKASSTEHPATALFALS